MTATTLPLPDTSHYGLTDAARSEWVKLSSLRSVRLALAGSAAATIALSIAVSAATQLPVSAADRARFDPTNNSLAGLAFAELAIGVLGVLVMTGEYSSGSIRASLCAIPRRPMLLAAKAAVFGAVALVVGEVATVAAFLAGQAAMSGSAATLDQPHVLRALLGSGFFLALVGLMGLGLGALLRHSAGAIAALFAVLLVLPVALHLDAMSGTLYQYAPEALLSSSVATTVTQTQQLSPWAALGLMAGYAASALVAGGIALCRRDA
jgi:ABC-2 type transport system permease protein